MATSNSKIPVLVEVIETSISVDVSADYTSAGDIVSYSGESTRAILRNVSRLEQSIVQYRVDSGAWFLVDMYQTSSIDIDFSNQILRIRRVKHSRPVVSILLDIQSLPGSTLYAGDDEDVIEDIGSGPGSGGGISLSDVPAFVGTSAPSSHPTRYLWVQTGLGSGTDMTFWVEDGQ